jgi:hypothetical protein
VAFSETAVDEARLSSALCLSGGCAFTILNWQRLLDTSSPPRAVLRHQTGTGEGGQFESGRRGSAGNLRLSLACRFAFHQVGWRTSVRLPIRREVLWRTSRRDCSATGCFRVIL